MTSHWELVAEMEAVLRPACQYAEKVQRDKQVTIGLSWIHILYMNEQIARTTAYKVVDFNETWDCAPQYAKLKKKRVLPQNLLPEAQELRKRLIDEVNSYFERPKAYELLTLVLDPIVWTIGKDCLKLCDPGVIEEAWTLMKAAYKAEGERYLQAQTPEVQPAETRETLIDEDSNFSVDFVSMVQRRRAQTPLTPEPIVRAPNMDASTEELETWKTLVVNWNEVFAEQGLAQPEPRQLKDVKLVAGQVDILKWWKKRAARYPIIPRLALRYLAKPDSNGFQERVFSRAKAIDSPLRQRLSKWKYEMLTLSAVNGPWMAATPNSEDFVDSSNLAQYTEQLRSYFEDGTENDEELDEELGSLFA